MVIILCFVRHVRWTRSTKLGNIFTATSIHSVCLSLWPPTNPFTHARREPQQHNNHKQLDWGWLAAVLRSNVRFHDNGHTGNSDPLPPFLLFIHWQADVQLVLYAHFMDGTFGEIQEEKVKPMAWKWLCLSLLLLPLISNSASSDNCTIVRVYASATTRTTEEQKELPGGFISQLPGVSVVIQFPSFSRDSNWVSCLRCESYSYSSSAWSPGTLALLSTLMPVMRERLVCVGVRTMIDK